MECYIKRETEKKNVTKNNSVTNTVDLRQYGVQVYLGLCVCAPVLYLSYILTCDRNQEGMCLSQSP